MIRDLVVDRSSLDRIITAGGGFISTATNGAPEALTLPVDKHQGEAAMHQAACIGCGACVAACPDTAAQLFTGSEVAHPAELPQGQVERHERVSSMVTTMEDMFGSCTDYGGCVPACPRGIEPDVIALLDRDVRRAVIHERCGERPRRDDVPWSALAIRPVAAVGPRVIGRPTTTRTTTPDRTAFVAGYGSPGSVQRSRP